MSCDDVLVWDGERQVDLGILIPAASLESYKCWSYSVLALS